MSEYTVHSHAFHSNVGKAFHYTLNRFPEIRGRVHLVIRENKIKIAMNTLPHIPGLIFKHKDKRTYNIFVNLNKDNNDFLQQLNFNQLVGWFAHEMGHIAADYINLNRRGFATFGLKYKFSSRAQREMEMSATMFAFKRGLGHQLTDAARNFEQSPFISNERKKDHAIHYVPRYSEVKSWILHLRKEGKSI